MVISTWRYGIMIWSRLSRTTRKIQRQFRSSIIGTCLSFLFASTCLTPTSSAAAVKPLDWRGVEPGTSAFDDRLNLLGLRLALATCLASSDDFICATWTQPLLSLLVLRLRIGFLHLNHQTSLCFTCRSFSVLSKTVY